jgi:hypothetical protein
MPLLPPVMYVLFLPICHIFGVLLFVACTNGINHDGEMRQCCVPAVRVVAGQTLSLSDTSLRGQTKAK